MNDQEHRGVLLNPVFSSVADERRVAQPLDEDEVSECSESNSTKDGYGVAQVLLVVESEHDSAEPHHGCSEEERYCHGYEDCYYNAECLAAVEQVNER